MMGCMLLAACKDKSEPTPSGEDVSNQEEIPATSGILDGHEWVDLGLPSGTLWATCNVGADSPEEYGDYFAWGETEPKSYYHWDNYKYESDYNQLTKYCNQSFYGKDGYKDNKTELDPEDDAATANWGSNWRMPTNAEQDEMRAKCQWEWTMVNGKSGYRVTGPNGNAIFFPFAGLYVEDGLNNDCHVGYFWSSTLYDGGPDVAFSLLFGSDYCVWYYYNRYYGQSVRAVVNR